MCYSSAFVRFGGINTCSHCLPSLIEDNIPVGKKVIVGVTKLRGLNRNGAYKRFWEGEKPCVKD